jgi:hypothetical protein
MRRKAFDKIASIGGVIVAAALLVAGGLLMWGYSFANSTVHDQLAQQQIFFPPAAAFAHPQAQGEITPSMIPSVSQYAGQQVLTGQQAEVYANDFIAVHLSQMPMGGVYSSISAQSRAHPTNKALASLVDVSFRGTTLRAMLLEAYGFWTFGQIALWAGIASFILAGLMLLLVGFGLLHARRVPAEAEFFAPRSVPVGAPV